jgi:hypothetical protein
VVRKAIVMTLCASATTAVVWLAASPASADPGDITGSFCVGLSKWGVGPEICVEGFNFGGDDLVDFILGPGWSPPPGLEPGDIPTYEELCLRPDPDPGCAR